MATLYFNGINGDTGEYLVPPLDLKHVGFREVGEHRDIVDGDVRDLAQAGWGVIFAADETEDRMKDLLEALDSLLSLRESQAKERYRVLRGDKGYVKSETAAEFLAKHKAASISPIDPEQLPYYLLIVGSPEKIPFEFQYRLDVSYAVGRIDFESLEEYAQYADNVRTIEESQEDRPRRAALFGVRHEGDWLTGMCADDVLYPLGDTLDATVSKSADLSQWKIERFLGEEATKPRLASLLTGSDVPDLLFTISHGVLWPKDHERLFSRQGALLCQDWPGSGNPAKRTHYYCADDLDAEPSGPRGLISFNIACFSAGMPADSDFPWLGHGGPGPIAPRPFVARLPQRMLSHPKGGALAVIGHVDQASQWSFKWPGVGPQNLVFRKVLTKLIRGYPVGAATESLGRRYAEVNLDVFDLFNEREQSHWREEEPYEMKVARNDARNYVVIGDPAVRIGPVRTSQPEAPNLGALREYNPMRG